MTDITLEDLADSGEAAAGGDGGETVAESGESLLDMVEFLDERGYLGPLMFSDGAPTTDAQPTTDATPATDAGDGAGVELNAANISALAEQVQAKVGDVPISKIGEFAEQNPERVNALVNQIGDDAGGGGGE